MRPVKSAKQQVEQIGSLAVPNRHTGQVFAMKQNCVSFDNESNILLVDIANKSRQLRSIELERQADIDSRY